MAETSPRNGKRARWLVLALVLCLAIGAGLFKLTGRPSRERLVSNRVEWLLQVERRELARQNAPPWLQEAYRWFDKWRKPNDVISASLELESLGPEAIPALSKALLQDPNPKIRELAADTLAESYDPAAVPALINALAVENDASVFPKAAQALANIEGSRAVPILVQAYGRQTNDEAAISVLQVVGELPHPLALQLLTNVLCQGTNSNLRSAAAESLKGLNCTNVEAILSSVLLSDSDASVRASAATTLGTLATPDGIQLLLDRSRNDLDPGVRKASVTAISPDFLAACLPQLLLALKEERNSSVRQMVMYALGRTRTPEAARALMDIAANDPDRAIGIRAPNELKEMLPHLPTSAVLKILQETRDEELRIAAATALAESGNRELAATLTQFVADCDFPAFYKESRSGCFMRTMPFEDLTRNMATHGMLEILPLVVEKLKRSPDESPLQIAACRVLASSGHPLVLPIMRSCLTNRAAPSVQCCAAAFLGDLGSEVDVRELTTMAKVTGDDQVRYHGLQALGEIGDQRVVPTVIQFLEARKDEETREAACGALGGLRDPVTSATLALLAGKDKSRDVRAAAIRALGEIGGTEATGALLTLLKKFPADDKQARQNIAEAFGLSGDLSTTPALIELLADYDQRVVSDAALALGKLGATNAVPKLLEVAAGRSAKARESAAEALGQIGDPSALPVLCRMLKEDRNPRGRAAAADALGALGDRRACEMLREALDDPEPRVRADAAWSLGHLGDRHGLQTLAPPVGWGHADYYYFYDHSAGIHALREMGGPEAIALLQMELGPGPLESQLPAAVSLAMLGQTNGFDVLRFSMDSASVCDRVMAIVGLAHQHSPAATALLHYKTNDWSPAIAHIAAGALEGKLTQVMIAALSDKHAGVRDAVATAFLFHTDPAAIPALRAACTDRNTGARQSARLALRRLERMNNQSPPNAMK